jgi:hypothetical protein
MERGIFKRKEIVDNQELLLVDIEYWSSQAHVPNVDGVPLATGALVKNLFGLVDFVNENDGFELAFYKAWYGKRKWAWLFTIIQRTNNGWQGCMLNIQSVNACNAQLVITNPTMPDLYATLPDKNEMLQRAYNQPAIPCPVCGAKLSRHAIWAKSITSQNDYR